MWFGLAHSRQQSETHPSAGCWLYIFSVRFFTSVKRVKSKCVRWCAYMESKCLANLFYLISSLFALTHTYTLVPFTPMEWKMVNETWYRQLWRRRWRWQQQRLHNPAQTHYKMHVHCNRQHQIEYPSLLYEKSQSVSFFKKQKTWIFFYSFSLSLYHTLFVFNSVVDFLCFR